MNIIKKFYISLSSSWLWICRKKNALKFGNHVFPILHEYLHTFSTIQVFKLQEFDDFSTSCVIPCVWKKTGCLIKQIAWIICGKKNHFPQKNESILFEILLLRDQSEQMWKKSHFSTRLYTGVVENHFKKIYYMFGVFKT